MIKYNYEVSVNENRAKLNKDIFLFRGNRNIHYYFSIKGARFTFSKENEDLLESSNAIYAAVTVVKPNGVEVANAIAPVEDGLIHLKVTEDLIDEEVEVGDFDLVFDLFDDNEGAVTIPKIKGQFHVQERPCTTSIGTLSGNVNVVNQAVVDLAIATQENEQLIVVDDDGKYVKTTWVKGDKISIERLNKIEEGIEKNSTQYKEIANKIGKNEDGSDIELPTTDKTIKGAITELFQDVSNGKQLIATAITDKGVTTSSDSTFQTMATNIGNISGGNSSNNGFLTKPIYKEVEGEQYRLVYNEDFDGTDIDRNYWTDSHFISRVEKRYKSWTDYYLKNSILHLRIREDAPARGGASGDVAVSSIQTGEKNALHISSPVYHDVNPFWGLITQEGYYECKMKIFKATGGCHTAWWTVGIQDKETQKYEIDITEILAKSTNVFSHGTHTNGDSDSAEGYNNTTLTYDLADGNFFTVGFLWKENCFKWYINGTLVDTMNITTPKYPMMHFLSVYKRLSGTGWTGDADTTLGDVEFEIDYLKIYKKATTKLTNNVIMTNTDDITINIGSIYNIDDDRGCIRAMPSYCYVNWNDGSRTEHWVKWDTLNKTKENNITNKTPFTWNGLIHGLGKTATCNVTFNDVSVKSIKITRGDTVLNVDDTLQLTANILPEDATNKNVTWESSDTTKATVVNGLVTAKAEGDVVITCKSVENSSISDTYNISITSTRAVVFELDKDCYSNGIFTDKVANLSSTISNTTGITTDDNYIYFPQTGKFDFDISSLNLTKKVCLDMVFKFDISVLSGKQTYECGEAVLFGVSNFSDSFAVQGNLGLFGTLFYGIVNDPVSYNSYTEKGINLDPNNEIRITFNFNCITKSYEIYINNKLYLSGIKNVSLVFSKLANSYNVSRDFAGWYKYIRLYNGWLTQDELV